MYCVLSHMDQRSPKFYQLYTYFMQNQGAIMHENCWLVRTGFYFIHLLQYNMRYFLRRYSSKITIHQSIRIFQDALDINKLDLNNHGITRILYRIYHWRFWPHVWRWLLFVCVVLSVFGLLTACVVCGMYFKLMRRTSTVYHTHGGICTTICPEGQGE